MYTLQEKTSDNRHLRVIHGKGFGELARPLPLRRPPTTTEDST